MKSTPYQKGRAAELVFNEDVVKIDKDTYQVRSNTNPEMSYIVSDNTCSCKGFAFSGHCSHLAAVRLFKQGENKNC